MSEYDPVETELLNLLKYLDDAMVVLESLDEDNRPALVDSVKKIVDSFHNLHELEPTIKGSVPLELIDQIDKGINPDNYSKKLADECQKSAQRVEEKQKWMQSFKDSLNSIIDKNFQE